MRIHIRVTGRPAPQGSKKYGPAGQLLEASPYLKAWRSQVKNDTYRAYDALGVRADDLPLLRGPVLIERLAFRLGGDDRPDGPPDLDKLTRATLDALTQARVWEDDARVVEIRALSKRRPAPGEVPGADIVISTIEPHQDQMESDHVKRYILSLVEIADDPTADDIEVVSVTGTAEIIGIVLPHVGAALSADAPASASVAPRPQIPGAYQSAVAPSGTMAAGGVVADKPKRTRRTKAEMAAARAAEAGGATPAPVQEVPTASVDSQPFNPFTQAVPVAPAGA